jgi:hypothetical protein
MGHYDSCYEADEKEARERHERSVKKTYEDLLGKGKLSDDKVRDAVIYLLKETYDMGYKPEAEIHLRRLRNDTGFAR